MQTTNKVSNKATNKACVLIGAAALACAATTPAQGQDTDGLAALAGGAGAPLLGALDTSTTAFASAAGTAGNALADFTGEASAATGEAVAQASAALAAGDAAGTGQALAAGADSGAEALAQMGATSGAAMATAVNDSGAATGGAIVRTTAAVADFLAGGGAGEAPGGGGMGVEPGDGNDPPTQSDVVGTEPGAAEGACAGVDAAGPEAVFPWQAEPEAGARALLRVAGSQCLGVPAPAVALNLS